MKARVLIGLAALLLCPAWASAQSIASYEIAIAPQAAGNPVKVLSAPAVNVSCVNGPLPAAATFWFTPTDSLKVVFSPDPAGTVPARACTWQGPAVSSLGLTPGTLYVATVAAINDANMKSGVSPASNPFGLGGAPPTPSGVVITK